MKLKLLLGTLLLTAVTANAQLTSINENFDTFVAGPAGPAAAWPQKKTGIEFKMQQMARGYMQQGNQ